MRFSSIRMLALLTLALFAQPLYGQEIQFVETFALADDRAEVLDQLIPGTEPYYYYHSLHHQHMGQLDQVDELMKPWVKRFGNSSLAQEIQNRQALLKYDRNPQETIAFLEKRIGLRFAHQRQIPAAQQELATALDQSLIDPQRLVSDALAASRNTDRLEKAALLLIADQQLDRTKLVHLLSRIEWPDFPNLIDLVERELRDDKSKGFGKLSIHNRLTLEQLDELSNRIPKLKQNTQFVNLYCQKLAPSADVAWTNNPEEQAKYLERVWSYVKDLDPVFNSLKACVRYHQLFVDRQLGQMDKERFLSYVKLPRRLYYVNPEYLKRFRTRSHEVNLGADYRNFIRVVPISNDESLVRDYLHKFLETEADRNEFRPYIESEFLKVEFATANILRGTGDVEKWASLLSPEQYKRLVERIDLEFAPTNQTHFKPGDEVQLSLLTKNIDKMIVKIFEINSENYYRRFGREIDTDINLDGLVPNHSATYEYDDAPAERITRNFEFPQMAKRGVYVVDFIGNGKSSRAIIRKGQLSFLSRVSLAGHEFTVVDENGDVLNDAELWIAGKLYESQKDDDGKLTGKILVPFSTQPRRQAVIVRHDDFASLDYFQHQSEAYSLTAGIYVDRESLLRSRKSQVVIRPQLMLSGVAIPVGLMENPQLQIVTSDQEGNQSTKSHDLTFDETGETVVEFQIPPRLLNVSFTVTGTVESMSLKSEQSVAAGATNSINSIETTEQIQDTHLVRSGADFMVEVRGKTGEPRPSQGVLVSLKSRYVKNWINASLRSDENGQVNLGLLAGITAVKVTVNGGQQNQWNLDQDDQFNYSSINSKAGRTIRLAADASMVETNRNQIGLYETRNGITKDWFEKVSVKNGLIEIDGLPAGDFVLVFKDSGRRTSIRVTDGELVNTTIFGQSRRLEMRAPMPLYIEDIAGGETIRVKVGGANDTTRVHIFASRFVPRFNAIDYLGVVRDQEPSVTIPGVRKSTYMSGRTIGDEYQYILDRRYTKKFVGNMLDRPSFLLNPMSISQADNQQNTLEGGKQFAGADDQKAGATGAAPSERRQAQVTGDFASLDFLSDGTRVFANLKPDADGMVSVDVDKLGNKQHLVVVAADRYSTVQRTYCGEVANPRIRDLRLTNAFDPASNVLQTKRTELLPVGKEFVIEDVLTAKFQSFDDLGDIYQVLLALNPDQHFSEFSFITAWEDKNQEQKQELYSKYACHELSFFLSKKDPEFFDAIVAPYIKNKREKTFLDHYLLGHDLSNFLQPWHFGKLNSVERILLAQRLENQKSDLIQHLNELYLLNPTSRVYAGQLYDSTVAAGYLFGDIGIDRDSDLELSFESLSRSDRGRMELADKTRSEIRSKLATLEDGRQRYRNFTTPVPQTENLKMLKQQQGQVGGLGGGGFGGRHLGEQVRKSELGRRAGSPANKPQSGVYFLEELDEAEKNDAKEFYKRSNADYFGTPGLDIAANGAVDRFADVAKGKRLRAALQSLYRRIAKTEEWIEQHYYRLLPQNHVAGRVTMNQFWRDFANNKSGNPFVSSNFSEAHRNFTEMMFVLSVMDIPFKAAEHQTEYVENQMRLTPGSPMIALHQQMETAIVERKNTTVLVSENFFQQNDRYRHEDGQRFDKFINDRFSAHTLYGAQVVITNPTSTPRTIELLIQIPKGAVVSKGSRETETIDFALQPFSTQSFEYSFYFPIAGDYTHFPAHVASNGKVVAVADDVAFKVVDEPVKQDEKSWSFVSQNGSNDEVIEFLNSENVLRLDLGQIAFRMKDKAFYNEVISTLRNRYVYNETLWAYSVKHNDIEAISEYLEHKDGFVANCGFYLESTPLTVKPIDRFWYEHREYSPLINARSHKVGKERKILNQKFFAQYHKFMNLLAHKPKLESEDQLAMTYYMLLQDRIEEAIEMFSQVDKSEIAEQIQYDYCDAYLKMYLEKPDEAANIAQLHKDHPVDRWRNRFLNILSHVEEIRGGNSDVADDQNQSEVQTSQASMSPSFDFNVEAGKVSIEYQNLSDITVNYYQMDIELLFSRNPFGQSNSDGYSLIRPNTSQKVDLDDSGKAEFELPAEMQNKNVTVEITAKDQAKSKAYYSNQLSIQMLENYGQLKVTAKDSGDALPKTYVKVYAQNADGSVKFFKDGYTDLRGRFDYATQSNYPLDGVQRFSILIMSDDDGTTVRQAKPPKE